MYLSKNSRYVLQKAQFLSPSFLKGVEKNLSVKTPKDDPTKPPLRVNIPEDNPRSSSIVSSPKATIRPGFEDGLLPNAENADIQFSKFTVDDVLVENNLDPKPPPPPPPPENSSLSPQDAGGQEQAVEDLQEKLQEVYAGDKYYTASAKKENESGEKEKEAEASVTSEADGDSKTLYIIIDVPDKKGEKRLSAADLIKEKNSSLFQDKSSSLVRGLGQTIERKSKSLPRFSTFKHKPPNLLKNSLEIHELEDASTYVFHLKLNKAHRGVVCVPERDITTRNGGDKNDESIKARVATGSKQPLRKTVTLIEDRAEIIKYTDDGKVAKMSKTEDSRRNSVKEEVGKAEGDAVDITRPEDHPSTRRRAEDKVGFNVFVRDDFGSIRTGVKTYPFKMPSKYNERKQDDITDDFHDGGKIKPEIDISTNEWWTNDPLGDAKMNLEIDMTKVSGDVNTSREKPEYRDRPGEESRLPPPNKAPETEYVNVSDVVSDKPLTVDSPMYRNLRDTMYDERFENYSQPKEPLVKPEPTSPYYHIEEMITDKGKKSMKHIVEKKPKVKPKKGKSTDKFKKMARQTEAKKADGDGNDFHTTARCLSIGCETVSSGLMNFGSAFPPLLSEALKNRFTFRKEFPLKEKWNNPDVSLKVSKQKGIEENSILFPEKESESLDCDSLFSNKDDIVANLIKNSETEAYANKRVESDMAASAAAHVDSLTVMKKVKEIVQFDLNNAVKIFDDGSGFSCKEQPSVVMLKDERTWEVDKVELARHIQIRKNEMRMQAAFPPSKTISIGENLTGDMSHLPLFLPPEGEAPKEMKLSDFEKSVIVFDNKTDGFFIQKDALAKAISERANEALDEITRTLNILAKDTITKAKTGDSILVFDVETQRWKVDFSILEKRQQQQQIEEELTKRSEAILETFERLEKEQITAVPKPNTTEKKVFDYQTEEWKAYNAPKKPRSKLPFKKSNAEEIRKKNSDMFDNMFDDKKKTAMKKPGVESQDPTKRKRFCSSNHLEASGSDPPKGSGGPANPANPTNPPNPPIPSNSPKPGDSKAPLNSPGKTPAKEEDHFWETFLKIHIPPQPSKEIPTKIPPPVRSPGVPGIPGAPSPRPKEQPSSVPNMLKIPKIEDPKAETPKKKIEEPRFRIHLPFIREKKIDKSQPTPKTDKKVDDRKAPPPPSSVKIEKEDSKIKAPPPPSPTTSKGDPPKGIPTKSPPTIGSPGKPASGPGSAQSPPAVSVPGKSGSGPISAQSPHSTIKVQDPKPSAGKIDKTASASDHYVSDKIIEISRNKNAEHPMKLKRNKIETVKLNITSDTRMPSKITEINLNKKSEEKGKESTSTKNTLVETKPSKVTASSPKVDKTKLNKQLESFKTPYSDPEFEEKVMKIKSDLDSNPNLKKLENWSKTLVLHDIMKPPESLESWLKDETDKMATLLLKVLQEAGDGKSKKKNINKSKDKQLQKGKQKTPPDNFFFRVQTMNLALGKDKNLKPENSKMPIKAESVRELPIPTTQIAKPSTSLNAMKLPNVLNKSLNLEGIRPKLSSSTTESILTSKDILNQIRLPLELTDEIPGPEVLKKISNIWKRFPILGSQLTIFSLHRIYQLVNLGSSIMGNEKSDGARGRDFTRLFNKYGPIVNIQGPLSGNIILLHRSEHLNSVFDHDAATRSVFDSLEQSRKDLEEKSTSSITVADWTKPEWNDLRRATNDPALKGYETYFRSSSSAADSLVYIIRKNRNSQDLVSEDFMHEIKRWSLEGLCSVLFEKSFGYLEGRVSNESWIMEPERLYMAMDEATNYLSKCERGFQAWRLMTTPSMAGLTDSYRSIFSILAKQLNQAEMSLKNKSELLQKGSFTTKTELSFIESMLLNDGQTYDDIICNLTDTMLIGANTMNSALGFLLYNLAQNPQAQKKLFSELKEALPGKNSQLDYNKLTSLKYLQACLKETLRLHIPIPVFYRLLQNDILVANYIIPKGTYVVMDYALSSMKEPIFEEPNKFSPERWLNDEILAYKSHPFASFPFCNGPRAELVKRVVEMQLLTGIAKIIRNFGIEYHYGDIRGTDTLISFPDKPLKLNFIERDC